MKIRNGFVSNSSSSSFIIKVDDKFKTVYDVAKYIIKKAKSNKSYIEKLSNMLDKDTPIYFNIYDDTYIRKVDDKIIISTSQHINLPKIEEKNLSTSDIDIDFFKKFDYIDEYNEHFEPRDVDDFETYYDKFNDFLNIKYEIRGRKYYIEECSFCGRLFTSGWLLENGEKICNCQIDKVSANIRRTDRLKKINKNES